MSRYMIWDLETENHKTYKRFCNPFDTVNWVVMRGWKFQGDTKCSWSYHDALSDTEYTVIPDDVSLLIGHNLKFDMLFEWGSPYMKAFFKRGGKIWDTQYVEYLLGGMSMDVQMNSMDSIIQKYGGRLKINAVKELWEAGYLTSEIDRDLLTDYLVGTEEELRNSGDIGNTEMIFLGQLKQAKELGMVPMIFARMDGLCCTAEMEYNGLKIDIQEGKRKMDVLTSALESTVQELDQYIPELPPELTFNWNSGAHVSALIFGGSIKYRKQTTYIDPNTGELARKNAVAQWPLFNGVPKEPGKGVQRHHNEDLWHDANQYPAQHQDTYTSGKKKGVPKFKAVKVQGELKVRYQDFLFMFPGYTAPKPKWELDLKDGAGDPIYSTDADTITELGERDLPFLKALAKRAEIDKDLGTYYVRFDEKKNEYKGMLTCVMKGTHIIHHSLNHVSTVTSRLSSSNPNMQNLPRDDKSEVKKMFISRFLNGKMLEADYSQLEVVVQGLLSLDENLCADIRNRVDFHCKRVAYKHGIEYAEAVARCKDELYPEYKFWKNERTKAKEFSFQRAYGAGAAKISETTGMSIDDVKLLMDAEEKMYPGVQIFNQMIEAAVNASAKPFRDPVRGNKVFRRGYWQAPTGTRYTWRSWDAPSWLQKRGVKDSFKPTELKNYPVQGTGGEIVQIILGRLWRKFVSCNNYDSLALLCNTVHDCIWVDADASVVQQVAIDVKRIMESVPEVLHELYGMNVPVPFPVEIEVGDNMYNKELIHIKEAA